MTQSSGGAGIWMGGAGLASDSNSRLFFTTVSCDRILLTIMKEKADTCSREMVKEKKIRWEAHSVELIS